MAKTKKKDSNETRHPVDLTEAEWEIMKAVWSEQPCTAGTVQEALANSRGWAYSTVKTTMDRMVDKGLLKIERIRNLQLFTSCITQIDAKRAELRKMLKRAFDGALTPMMQFLIEHEGISSNEAAQLRKLVNTSKRKSKKST